jgi:phospholipase/lecithinase/hemolysin
MHYLLALALAFALPAAHARGSGPPSRLNTLVTFGDSYTDTVNTGDAGVAWPTYAASYAPAQLFPFARAGATCSQDLTPRTFPAVFQSQLPAYFAELANGTVRADPARTLYTLWIGTNDVGPNTLLTGGEVVNNATIVDTTACAVSWVSALYKSGARNFLFQNVSARLLQASSSR